MSKTVWERTYSVADEANAYDVAQQLESIAGEFERIAKAADDGDFVLIDGSNKPYVINVSITELDS